GQEVVVEGQQALHLGVQVGVARTGGVQEGSAFPGGQLGRLVEQRPHPRPPFLRHVPPSAPPAAGSVPSCRASQARAERQSRSTVRTDSPTTLAVSSTLMPVK